MQLSENLRKLLRTFDNAGFKVEQGIFDESSTPDDSELYFHQYAKGMITYSRVLETANYDNKTVILTPIETIQVKLYVPPNSEEIEEEFFDILKQNDASYDIEDFDQYVTNDLIMHSLVVTAV